MVLEQTFVNCANNGPIKVCVKDGKIVRVRPMVFDEKDTASWAIDVSGKKFAPTRKATVAPQTFTERMKVYSEDRIKYPLKRIDFDPEGERKTKSSMPGAKKDPLKLNSLTTSQ